MSSCKRDIPSTSVHTTFRIKWLYTTITYIVYLKIKTQIRTVGTDQLKNFFDSEID